MAIFKRTGRGINACRILVVALAVICSGLVNASSTYWCSGQVNGVYITKDGDVIINGTFRNDWVRVCNLNNSELGVTTVVCSLWASYVANALKEKLNIRLMYAEVDFDGCNNIPTYYAAPIPAYIMLE